MRRTLSVLTGAVLALSAAFTALTALLYAVGTDDALMLHMFQRHAPVSSTLLLETEYRPVAEMTTAFLAAETDEFQHVFIKNGTEYACFAPHEQQHMQDVQQLFALCRSVLIASAVVLIIAVAAASFLVRKTVLKTAAITFCAILLLVLALGVWGMVDFEGLFILFHKLSFSNDLWLLNPATDLLIRLMPTGFFIEYAALVGGSWLLICALSAAAAWIYANRGN